MEISKKYETAIIEFFNSYIEKYKKTSVPVKPELVLDKEHQRYILLLIGWDNARFVYAPLFHFDIIQDKVWIQHNGTDIIVTDELLSRDIPKQDIIIGFKPDHARAYSGFGVA